MKTHYNIIDKQWGEKLKGTQKLEGYPTFMETYPELIAWESKNCSNVHATQSSLQQMRWY